MILQWALTIGAQRPQLLLIFINQNNHAHDTPQDGRFIRRFFEIYCFAALIGALGASASYAIWGRPMFALGAAAIASAVLMFRRTIIPAMARMGASIQANDPGAIADFRKIHATALLVNLIQLIVLVWGVLQISV